MIKINITQLDGTETILETDTGHSLMEALRQEGIDGIDAICGGACSCATCHVHLTEDWLEKLPVADENEEELLADCEHRLATSRLSCQIPLSDDLDGLVLRIAEAD